VSGALAASAGLAGLAVAAALARPRQRRLADALPPPPKPPRSAGTGRTPERTPQAACVLAAVAAVLVLGLPTGLLVGLPVALVGPPLLRGLEPAAARREREQLAADLPLVLDLLGACLSGGATLPSAAAAVAEAVPGPAGRRLAAVRAALSVGTPAHEAWQCLSGSGPSERGGEDGTGAAATGDVGRPVGRQRSSTGLDDPLAPAARALARAAEGGAPVADAVARLAVEARAVRRAGGEQAARRAGVLAVAPLGLCFLPAFVLLGVVPVVAGLAAPLLEAL
jgi:Flp pilus assembly protein TadB